MNSHTATDWNGAYEKVRQIAAGLTMYLGTGAPIETPHVMYRTMDAWSGEGGGYNVVIFPEGDRLSTSPRIYHEVRITGAGR